MHSLRQRYGGNLMHTYAGPNLLVINPVTAPAMYSEKVPAAMTEASILLVSLKSLISMSKVRVGYVAVLFIFVLCA